MVSYKERIFIKQAAQILHDQFIEPPQKLSIVSRFKALFS
jgi:hypothetical protein